MQTQAMEFPIQHPPIIACNQAADQFSQLTHYNPKLLMKAKQVRRINCLFSNLKTTARLELFS